MGKRRIVEYLGLGCTTALILLAGSALAEKPVLTLEPSILRGIPGEPLTVELTVETDRAAPVQVQIPSVSNLVLRTVERVPIRRTPDGRFSQKRILIWQGVEAGETILTNLTAVIEGTKVVFPEIHITVDAVQPAEPPAVPDSSASEDPKERTGDAE